MRLDIDRPIGAAIGISGADVNAMLAGIDATEPIDLHINSPGGSAFDGVAIYNRLKRHGGRVRVYVDGLAASAASIIAMAGDEITVSTGAEIMIHEAWGVTIGDAKDHTKQADTLTKLNGGIVDIYHERTGKPRAEIARMMADETWMTDTEAVNNGFATAKSPAKASLSAFDVGAFNYRHPDRIAAMASNTPTKKPMTTTTPTDDALAKEYRLLPTNHPKRLLGEGPYIEMRKLGLIDPNGNTAGKANGTSAREVHPMAERAWRKSLEDAGQPYRPLYGN